MRSENNTNTLDLNNLPNEPFPFFQEGSSSSSSGGFRDEKESNKDGKEYECRFCSLKFCKSQALGGHMNRHRQERETESLNKARELVLRNDSYVHPPHHQRSSSFCYHQGDINFENSTNLYKPMMYPSRVFSTSSLPPPRPPLVQPYLYPPNVTGPPSSSSYTLIGAPVAHSANIHSHSHSRSHPHPPHHGM